MPHISTIVNLNDVPSQHLPEQLPEDFPSQDDFISPTLPKDLPTQDDVICPIPERNTFQPKSRLQPTKDDVNWSDDIKHLSDDRRTV